MAVEHYRSAELVFGWSFYRQGSSRGSSSADEFLDAALTWFGDPDPRIGTAWEKGERLAKLVVASSNAYWFWMAWSRSRTRLVHKKDGYVQPALQALLRELAAFNTGLCVITHANTGR